MRVRIAAALILITAAVLAFWIFRSAEAQPLDESKFYEVVSAGRVQELTLTPDAIGFSIRGTLRDSGGSFSTYVLADPELPKLLLEQGVSVTAEPAARSYLALLFPLLILLVVGVVAIVFILRMQSGGNQLLAMRRSRAKLSRKTGKITFEDVAGVEEAKQELEEIVEFLREPAKFQRLGGKIPKGVLLMGPPGTGKTLLARAVAGEADVPFFSVSGSDFVEMFVGIGASRVRDLFEQGRKNAPCIVFIDELDAVGRQRGTGVGGGHDEREQTLNQLLVELDGFENHDGMIVIAATNRPDVLDPALLRPGRFDRQVVVDRPDVRGREQIVRIHSRKVPLNDNVELGLIARGTPGFSGADLANLVNEAALHAAGRRGETVNQEDFEYARDKVWMGSARRSLVINKEERRAMAYRQAGHALLAHLLPDADPLHKVTILPRGRDLGTTQQFPADDRHTDSKAQLIAKICGLMGGRVAEELHLKQVSTDAGDEFERATKLARAMVTKWGMSSSLGPLAYGKSSEQIFLGRQIAKHRDFSEATAAEIDREVKKIVVGCYDEARRILESHSDALIVVAEALMVLETLNADELASLVRGEPLPQRIEVPLQGETAHEVRDEPAVAGSIFPKPDTQPA